MPLINKFTALLHGLETNSNGGIYHNGATYPLKKKLEAQEQIFEAYIWSQKWDRKYPQELC